MLGLERTGWRGGRWLGMGVGVQWVSPHAVYTQAVYTHHCKVGEAMTVEGASVRLGLTLSKSFKCVASSLLS